MKTKIATSLKVQVAAILLFAGVSTFLNTAGADKKIWEGHVIVEEDKIASFGGYPNDPDSLLAYVVAAIGEDRRDVFCVLVCVPKDCYYPDYGARKGYECYNYQGCYYRGDVPTSQGPAREADILCYKITR